MNDDIFESIFERIMDCREIPIYYKLPLIKLATYGTYEIGSDCIKNISVPAALLAAKLGCSPATVKKAIKAGVALGIVTVTHHQNDGRPISNEYTINIPAIFKNLSAHDV